MIPILAMALAGCTVTDGDTIRCGDERIRLLAIDAPELPGHCARGRACVEGDPFASRRSLQNAMRGKKLTITRAGTDRYGRTVGVVFANGQSLSCWQLKAGAAVYVTRYDNDRLVAHGCPELAHERTSVP